MTYAVPRMTPEGEAWLGLLCVCNLLPSELDAQLSRDSGATHYRVGLMSYLRAMPESTASMSEITEATDTTLPRVSHVRRRLEGRGLVKKSISLADRRVSMATLTAAVRRELVRATPRHIATARRLVIDALSPEGLAHLSRITAIVGENLDPLHRFGPK